MEAAKVDASLLKQTLKEALVEALQEQRELFHEVLVEALEDLGLARAVQEGLATEPADREEVMALLGDPE